MKTVIIIVVETGKIVVANQLRLIPKKYEEAEIPAYKNSIGFGPIESAWKNDDQSLKNSLNRKAKHYKDKSNPFIIAINTWLQFGSIDEIDVLNALLGSEVLRVRYDDHLQIQTSAGRESDGFWFGPKGPRNRHVSGVLLFSGLFSWTIHQVDPILYLHPFAEKPIYNEDFYINTVTWDIKTGEMKKSNYESENIFGLSSNWLDDE